MQLDCDDACKFCVRAPSLKYIGQEKRIME